MMRELTKDDPDARRSAMARLLLLMLLASLPATGGCVSVTAPEKPIEINLNVTIRQEVIVRLDQEVKNLIKEKPGIF